MNDKVKMEAGPGCCLVMVVFWLIGIVSFCNWLAEQI